MVLIIGVEGVKAITNNFDKNAKQQIGQEFGLMVVQTKDDALTAMTQIIDEGEGGGDVQDSDSHYGIFSKLYNNYANMPWNIYQLPLNPNTDGYQNIGQKLAYKVGSYGHSCGVLTIS